MSVPAAIVEPANASDRQRAEAQFEAGAALDPTATAAFKNWFEGSTIVDGTGAPLMVYHGTEADFSQFNGGPAYFTPRQDYSYIQNSSVVMPVYLSIRNPYRPTAQSEIEQIRSNPDRVAELHALGYDGMLWAKDGNLMRGASGWGDDLPQIVAFSPGQVKSAIGNVGTFDPASPDIRFEHLKAVGQTKTREFKEWYGNSQLLDDAGQPLVFYHGTDQAITEFDSSKVQSRFPFSFGFHFTSRTSEASIYADSITNSMEGFNPASQFSKPPLEGGNVMPVYLRAERPLVINTDMLAASMEADTNRAQIMAKLADARRAGQPYDSVIIKRERGDEYDGTNVIVFEPGQIKSAIGNVGTFERQSADIRFDKPSPPSAFSTWFAESKVVGADGKPLVVYHGTGADIRSFRIGAYFTAKAGQADDYAAVGADVASDGAANVIPVYLSIQNPAVVETDYIEWAGYEATEREALIAQGYDGMMNAQMTEIVPFYRGQVKSAVGNVGTYDRASGDIRFDGAARVPATSTPEFNNWFQRSTVKDDSGTPLVVYHGSHQDFTVFTDQSKHLGFHFGTAEAATIRLEDTADATMNHAEFIRLHQRAATLWLDASAYREKLNAKSAQVSAQELIDYAASNSIELWEAIARFAYQPTAAEVAELERLTARYDRANVIAHKYGEGAHVDAFYLSIQKALRLPDVGDWSSVSAIRDVLPWDSDAVDVAEMIEDIKSNGYDGIVYLNKVEAAPGNRQDSYICFDAEQIKSAYANVGTFDSASPDVRFSTALPREHGQTALPAFKEWFKGSKVTDPLGNPLRVFRGTTASSIDSFTEGDFFGSGMFGKGINFTSDPADAGKYASTDVEVNLDLTGKASIMADALGIHYNEAKAVLTENGGAVYPVYLSMQSPLIVGAAPIAVERSMFMLAATEAGVTDDDSRDRFWRYFSAAATGEAQLNVARHHRATTIYRQMATLLGHDGLIVRPEVAPLGSGATHYLVLDPKQIKSASGNDGSFGLSTDIRFAFGGAYAQTANRQTLATAKSLTANGEHPEQIRRETGWSVGVEGKWRFEIDDSTLVTKESWNLYSQDQAKCTFRITDLIDHWQLFDAYPQLRSITVEIDPSMPSDSGMFHNFENKISLSSARVSGLRTLTERQLGSLVHELQHAIQDIEKFAQGGSPFDKNLPLNIDLLKSVNAEFQVLEDAARQSPEYHAFIDEFLKSFPPAERMREGRRGPYDYGLEQAKNAAYEAFISPINRQRLAKLDKFFDIIGLMQGPESRVLAYRLLAGEAEARNVTQRMLLTAEQRLEQSPEATMDVPVDSLYVWNGDDVRLALQMRHTHGFNATSPTSGTLRLNYSDSAVNADMLGLAELHISDGHHQFDNYELREQLVVDLVERLEANHAFTGMVLPVSFGYVTLTGSAKQAGAWQVTALDKRFSPLSDEGIQTKREALISLLERFDTSSAFAVLSGSAEDIHLAPRTPAGPPPAPKGSTLADDYAEMRSMGYGDDSQDRASANVMPVYLSAKTPFDADLLVGNTVRLSDLRDALVKQAEQAGRHVDVVKIGALFRTAFLAARNEESGPYYARHDLWSNTDSMFGAAGRAALRQMFAECGFDSIKLTERGHLTYGVFEPSQVKSAIGNTGFYSSNPDMRFTFAGSRAAKAPRSMLARAEALEENFVAPELIWKETGWTRGFDTQWRFELDDSNARIRGFDYTTYEPEMTTTRPERYLDWSDEAENALDGVPLPMVLDHPALFAAYPQMANVRVKTFPSAPDDGTVAYFAFWPGNFGLSQIFVRDQYSIDPDLFRSALIHEIQHGVQHLEGFAPGATPDAFKGSGTVAPELLAKMRTYVDIAENATELACPPQHFAEVSGQSADIVERVTSWVHQGNWEANIASFRRDLMSPYQLYLHEAGEVEARNTQQRLFLNGEQRAELFPGDTLDVDGALVRVTTRLFAPSATMMAPMERKANKADSSLEWALKTHAWRAGRCDDAELIQAGESVNLYKMGSTTGPDREMAEIFAVDLQGNVVGAFLYGPGAEQKIQVAAMVAPLHRRQGIAGAACDMITRLTGRDTQPADALATGPSQSFWASREGRVLTASQSDSAALTKWFGNSHTVDANGKPQVFFHGTHTAFKMFDASRHRSILNNRYQGDAFHFTKSPAVASQYASAARNQLFRQQDLFAAADQALPFPIAQLLKGAVLEGDAIWDKFSGEQIRDLCDFARASGIDLNDIVDIADYVEGSASARPSTEINLFATHHDRDMPEHVKVDAIALGLGDAIPAPVVMPVFLKCENTLYTDDRDQARRAEQNGYDSVCYTGHDIVSGEPEWMVFSSDQIRSAFEFDKAAIVHRDSIEQSQAYQLTTPIAPPADRSFDRWIADTHCITLYGEPRLVFFHKPPTEQGHTFSDVDCALLDGRGKIIPAYLAIRAPFVVTDQHTISVPDLTQKLGDRKAALIIGEYLRDGALRLEDLFAHPRCAKWIEQAGYDGAIYRNLDGQNRYLTFQPNQALVGSGVSPDLCGPVIWGPVPQLPKLEFLGERVRSRQFSLANQSRPSGHIVPIAAADQYLASSGRLYVNMLGHERLTSVRIASLVEDLSNNKHMRQFLFSNRKALAGKGRIEDVFAEHIRNLRLSITEAREDASRDAECSSHHRVTEDRLRNALGWAVEVAAEGKSFKGILGQDLLIWNSPLAEQGELVRNALASLGIDGLYEVRSDGRPVMMTSNKYTAGDCANEYPNATVVQREGTTLTGRAIYEELASDLGNSRLASELLAGIGIIGARQSDNEVLLFYPEVNHKPMPPFTRNPFNRLAMANAEGFKVQDLGGVQIGGGLHHSLQALACNRDRALEVTNAAINLLTARVVAHQQGCQAEPDSNLKTRLAAAREKLQTLSDNIPSSSFLHWREPLASRVIEMISPIIRIDPKHQLPGSAVFELLARRQGGIDRAQDMLSSVGIYGAHDELATLCWHPAAEKILDVVASDAPPKDLGARTATPRNERDSEIIGMRA